MYHDPFGGMILLSNTITKTSSEASRNADEAKIVTAVFSSFDASAVIMRE
jgi:hypothetical protein